VSHTLALCTVLSALVSPALSMTAVWMMLSQLMPGDPLNHEVGSSVPVASRQGRQNQRYSATGERLVAGYVSWQLCPVQLYTLASSHLNSEAEVRERCVRFDTTLSYQELADC
jgi:hypothetical protein